MASKSPRRCMSTAGTPPLGHQAGQGGIEREAADVVDEVGAGVERGRAPRPAFVVSTERSPAPRSRRPRMTGTTRRHLLARVHAGGPARPRGLAADVHDVGARLEQRQAVGDGGIRRRRSRPPSENESGVTLSTPMTQVRSPRTASPPAG